MFTYLFDRFLRRVFSLLRVDRILCIHKALAWRHGFFLLVQDSFRFLYPEFGARSPPPICSRRPLFQNWFSYSLFLLTEAGGYFRFGILANHLASIFFLPLSGDSLGLLYVPVPHSLPIRSQRANICWFPFWTEFVTWGIDLDSSFNGQSLAC